MTVATWNSLEPIGKKLIMVVREPYFPKRHKPKLKDTAVRGVLKCLLASRRACSLMCTLDMVMEDNRNGTVSQGAG